MAGPPRFLYLQPRAEPVERVRAAFHEGRLLCDLTWVDGPSAFEAALDAGWAYDLVLADPGCPGLPAEDALALAQDRWPGTPFLLLGDAPLEPRRVLALLEAGARDVLSLADGRLCHGLRRALGEARLAEALRASREMAARSATLLRATLAATSEGVLITDLAGRVAAYNRRFLTLCGVPEHLMAPRAMEDLFQFLAGHFKDPGAFLAEARLLAGGRERLGLLHAADGQVLEGLDQPYGTEAGEGRTFRFRDVTAREEAAQERRREVERMEGLRRAWMDDLARPFAEHVRGHLRKIRNRLELLELSRPLTEAQRSHVKGGLKAAEGLAELLAPFAGGPPEPFRGIPAPVEDLLERVRPRLEAGLPREVRLQVDAGPGLPPVAFPPEHLEQVLAALVRNAAEALAGPGLVRIRASAPPGGAVILDLQDDGPGVAPEVRERMFDPFFTTRAQALGLGLYVARNLAERGGGALRGVPSDQGAHFQVELPAASKDSKARGI